MAIGVRRDALGVCGAYVAKDISLFAPFASITVSHIALFDGTHWPMPAPRCALRSAVYHDASGTRRPISRPAGALFACCACPVISMHSAFAGQDDRRRLGWKKHGLKRPVGCAGRGQDPACLYKCLGMISRAAAPENLENSPQFKKRWKLTGHRKRRREEPLEHLRSMEARDFHKNHRERIASGNNDKRAKPNANVAHANHYSSVSNKTAAPLFSPKGTS